MVDEQWKDEDTKTIIECIEMGKKPLHHELRQESPYMNSIMQNFETLSIINGCKYSDVSLIVFDFDFLFSEIRTVDLSVLCPML